MSSSTDDIKGSGIVLGLAVIWGIIVAIIEAVTYVVTAIGNWFSNLYVLTEYGYGWAQMPLLFGTLVAPLSIGFLIYDRNGPLSRFCVYTGLTAAIALSVSLILKYDIQPMVGFSQHSVWYVAFIVVPFIGSVSFIVSSIIIGYFGTVGTIKTAKFLRAFMALFWRDLKAFAAWLKKPARDKAESFRQEQQRAHQEEWAKRQRRRQEQQRRQEKSRDRGQDDFDPSRFGNKGKAYYGEERCHPDDAPLWAKVHDPSASDAEQQAALKMIQRKVTKRRQSTDGTAVA